MGTKTYVCPPTNRVIAITVLHLMELEVQVATAM